MRAPAFLAETERLGIQIPGVENTEKLLARAATLEAAASKVSSRENRQKVVKGLVGGQGGPQQTLESAARAVRDSGLSGVDETKAVLEEAAQVARREADLSLFGPKTRKRTWKALSDHLGKIGARAKEFEILPQIRTLDEAALLGYSEQWQALSDLSRQQKDLAVLAERIVSAGFFGRLPDRVVDAQELGLVVGGPVTSPPGFYEAAVGREFQLRDPVEQMEERKAALNCPDTGAPDPLLIPQIRRQEEREHAERLREWEVMKARTAEERAHVERLLAKAREVGQRVTV